MINYNNWGDEYFSQADIIRCKLDKLRKEAPLQKHDERLLTENRISILYSMYLECRFTGRLLHSKAQERRSDFRSVS